MAAQTMIDPTRLNIATESEGVNLNPLEPEFYLHVINGRIYLDPPSDASEDDDNILVGGFRLTYVNIACALDNRMPIVTLFDTSQDLMDIYEAVFISSTQDYTRKVIKLLGEGVYLANNILSIDRLGVFPAYRGNKIGLLVLLSLIQRYSMDTSIVAIQPCPLLFTRNDTGSGFCWDRPEEEPIKTGILKLKTYYEKVGFKSLRGSEFMLFSPFFRLPELEE
jgi:hypothetical protein